MTRDENNPRPPKISHEFSARLARLDPHQKVRAIVLIRTQAVAGTPGRRPARAERQAILEAIRREAGSALGDLDRVLERFQGRRLSDVPDALGSIAVETTPAGILALADSEHVQAVLEDQPIAPLTLQGRSASRKKET